MHQRPLVKSFRQEMDQINSNKFRKSDINAFGFFNVL